MYSVSPSYGGLFPHSPSPSMPCSSRLSLLELLMLEENAYQETERWIKPFQQQQLVPSCMCDAYSVLIINIFIYSISFYF